jgi:hypothetical protein
MEHAALIRKITASLGNHTDEVVEAISRQSEWSGSAFQKL